MRRRADKKLNPGIQSAQRSGLTSREVRQDSGATGALLTLQRASGNRAVTNLLAGSSGRPLDRATLNEMESRLGADFSDVRLHQGKSAAGVAMRSGARAVTAGNHIAFGEGFYSPGTPGGRKLIAHELAHVVQQSKPDARRVSSSAAESEARAAGASVISGRNANIQTSAGAGAQADPLTKDEIQQQIADNDAKAQQATSQQEVEELFNQRQILFDQLKLAPDAKAHPTPAPSDAGSKAPSNDAQVEPFGPPPPPAKNAVRTNYEADENAYKGLELEYTARGDYPTEGVMTPGVYKSKHYWLAPHLRAGTDKVMYYLAYNPETKRNEFVVGPGEVQNFLDHEQLYHVTAAGAYPLAGDVPDYKAQSGRVVARAMQGDLKGAFNAWKKSWVSASKNPQFWLEASMATSGALLSRAAPLAAEGGAVGGEVESAAGTAVKQAPALEGAAGDAPKPTVTTPPVTDTPAAPPVADTPAPVAPVADIPPAAPVVNEPTPAPPANAAPAASTPPTAATNTEQLFSEINQEMQSVSEAPGELQGTAQNEFLSPKPLQPDALDTPLKTPSGAAVRESGGANTRPGAYRSASAQTPRSLNTAIHSDVGEVGAYKEALQRGEIGLQRPAGSNVGGTDFITAIDDEAGTEIIVTDAKTSVTGKFPKPKGPDVKPSWKAEVDEAVKKGRLNLGDPDLEDRIRKAAAANKIRVRQINVNYSPAGGGSVSGF